jgi:imidazolonepropionase-like amidohydrolase
MTIENGRVSEVGARENITVPEDATSLDFSDRTVLPGLIDAHVHLLGTDSTDPMERVQDGPALKAARATVHLRDLLGAGFTSVRDMGSHIGIGLRDAVSEGAIPGPRIYTSGLRFSQTAGHGDVHSLPYDWVDSPFAPGNATLVDGKDECRKGVRKRVRENVDLIKIMTTGGVLSEIDTPTQSHFTPEEISALVKEAHRFELPVGCHASGAEGIKNALRNGVDTLEHGTYLDEEAINLLLSHDVPVVTTATPMYRFIHYGPDLDLPEYALKKAKTVNEAHLDSMQRAYDAGVSLALGSDLMGTELLPHGENVLEAERLVDAVGMDEMDVIKAGTSVAARCVWDDQIGALEPERRADFIVTRGDPLSDIRELRNVTTVYKDGERTRIAEDETQADRP